MWKHSTQTRKHEETQQHLNQKARGNTIPPKPEIVTQQHQTRKLEETQQHPTQKTSNYQRDTGDNKPRKQQNQTQAL